MSSWMSELLHLILIFTWKETTVSQTASRNQESDIERLASHS